MNRLSWLLLLIVLLLITGCTTALIGVVNTPSPKASQTTDPIKIDHSLDIRVKDTDSASKDTKDLDSPPKESSPEEAVPNGKADKHQNNALNEAANTMGNSQVISKKNNFANKTTDKSKEVLSFYTNDEGYLPSSYHTLVKQADSIDWVAPFWFRLDAAKGSGHVELFKSGTSAFKPMKAKEIVDTAHDKGIKVLAVVHNLLYGSSATSRNLAHEMVSTEKGRAHFINDLENILEKYHFDGINMDMEYFRMDDRDNFSKLMQEMYQTLKPLGYTITISVPAKTRDDRSNSWSGPFDYAAIGKYADTVVLMTYDEHGYASDPGPIASVGWVEKVINYALTQIPAGKIFMGIPAYGFDWTQGSKSPKYISYALAQQTLATSQQKIRWDNEAKAPYYIYWDKDGKKHQVWFENASSLSHKLELVKKYNIKGIGIWRIGMEDPKYWPVIDQYFQKQ
ncbi:glycosyl hydrolase family 18 protein [Metallumcola ferriviriculae]|uniref:Glycosyl hydrolase family 18 protein n=1 Tax=Metallumcola ferriviriculae TaxID=3039180 RepID=A0AAU0UNU8_9FIRM|nr:glycosyl hydrolase family 18 protein [Desulfitibacteraceae bacterium MK1]